jgi:rhodanese-related sulfurtransferase
MAIAPSVSATLRKDRSSPLLAAALARSSMEIAARAPAEIGPSTTRVVLYCRTGKASAKAAATLKSLGYRYVYDLGSYLNWGEGAPAQTPLPPAV